MHYKITGYKPQPCLKELLDNWTSNSLLSADACNKVSQRKMNTVTQEQRAKISTVLSFLFVALPIYSKDPSIAEASNDDFNSRILKDDRILEIFANAGTTI